MKPSTYPIIPLEEAARRVLDSTAVLPAEEVDMSLGLGRVLATDLIAPFDLPLWPVSAVDGYAVRAADRGARSLIGESAAGRPYGGRLEAGQAVTIMTGAVLPSGADTVIMLEEVQAGRNSIEVPPRLEAGKNFYRPGDDICAGQIAIRKGVVIGGPELALAVSMGLATLRVHAIPRVALLGTGDELVEFGQPPSLGQIPDSNRWSLSAALTEAGAKVVELGVIGDDLVRLRRTVTEALQSVDVLVTSGGVSVGEHDLVKPMLAELGTIHVGRVDIKPGKPFTFGCLPEGRIAFGLPGFPVSALVTFEVLVRPAILKMAGRSVIDRPRLRIPLACDVGGGGARPEFRRMSLLRARGGFEAEPTGSQSSSRLASMVGAHALWYVPPESPALCAGQEVELLILGLP
ncbi:MAG TPA: gephyrin-like molybdotransferase Glp [Candidatus Dormibacteraeota bacterium]|nr:gephyrin-like molybdotransferase Glp [Candidatus Dormibacteraeota bacterium]